MAEKVVTWNELLKHKTKDSCWVLVDSKVYDVTKYLEEHPGGAEILLKYAGKDATAEFAKVKHSSDAIATREKQLVGTIESKEQSEEYQKQYINSVKVGGKISWDEIKKHNKEGDCWSVIYGKVYNFSNYMNTHPGGPVVILGRGGKDATKAYELARHPEKVKVMREAYEIGVADGKDPDEGNIQDNSVFNLTNLICAIIIAAIAYYFLVANQ